MKKLVLNIQRESLKQFNYKHVSKILKIKELGVKILLNEIMISLSKSGFLKEEKRGCFKLVQTTHKAIGIVNNSTNSGIYIDVENIKEEIFIPNEYSFFSLKNDIVDILIFPKKRGKLQGEVLKVIERKKDTFVGLLEEVNGFGFLITDSSVPFDVFIPKSEFNPLVIGKKVLIKVKKWDMSQKNPVGKIIKVIGNPNDHNTEIHSILYQYNLNPEFPKYVEKELKKFL